MTDAAVNIPRDVIEPIVQAKVALAVAEALGGHQDLVALAVTAVLTAKVDSDGRVGNYANRDSLSYVQWIMRDCIRKTVSKVLQDEMPKHEHVIREHIIAQLQNKKSPLVKQLVEGMVKAVTSPNTLAYRLTVDVSEKQ